MFALSLVASREQIQLVGAGVVSPVPICGRSLVTKAQQLITFFRDGFVGFGLLGFELALLFLLGVDEFSVILGENLLELDRVFTFEVVQQLEVVFIMPVGGAVTAIEIQTNELAVVVYDLPCADLTDTVLNRELALHSRLAGECSESFGGTKAIHLFSCVFLEHVERLFRHAGNVQSITFFLDVENALARFDRRFHAMEVGLGDVDEPVVLARRDVQSPFQRALAVGECQSALQSRHFEVLLHQPGLECRRGDRPVEHDEDVG